MTDFVSTSRRPAALATLFAATMLLAPLAATLDVWRTKAEGKLPALGTLMKIDHLPNGTTDPAAMSSEPFDRQGEHAFRAGDYMAPNRAWQHAVVDDPSNGALAMKLALALFAVGKYQEAAGTTQQVLMLLPQEKWGQAVGDYKKLYRNPKDYLDQLKNLAKAAADKPNDPALRFLLGFHYGYSGRVADAVRELNKLVQLEPKDQLGRKLRDLMADKTHKDNNSVTAMASSDIYVRKDSNGTLYFSNVPADLKNQPLTWHRTQY